MINFQDIKYSGKANKLTRNSPMYQTNREIHSQMNAIYEALKVVYYEINTLVIDLKVSHTT